MKKIISIISCLISAVYSICYAGLGGFAGNKGALSKIGLDHPVLFAIWGILTIIAIDSNVLIGFKKMKYKFQYILLGIAAIGMIMTLCFDFDYNQYNEYILHCIGSMTFSIITGISVFLLFLLSKNYLFTILSGGILIIDLILLIIFKETAIIELMPMFAGYIMLTIHNNKEKEFVEVK